MFFLSDMLNKKLHLPRQGEALRGRDTPLATASEHFVLRQPLKPPFPDGIQTAFFGMGRFWGAERLFWQTPGVHVTAVGYQGGATPNPTYQETCTGMTGHAEVVMVAFDPQAVSYADLLKLFWEGHDPTEGMRQGNDVGTMYRSALYAATSDQLTQALGSRDAYGAALASAGRQKITTEIAPAQEFYYAEADHQQYLAKNPSGANSPRGAGIAFVLPA